MEDIKAAKKALEQKIIANPHVMSVGTRARESGDHFIHVSVDGEEHTSFVQAVLTAGKWHGFDVAITVQPISEPH